MKPTPVRFGGWYLVHGHKQKVQEAVDLIKAENGKKDIPTVDFVDWEAQGIPYEGRVIFTARDAERFETAKARYLKHLEATRQDEDGAGAVIPRKQTGITQINGEMNKNMKGIGGRNPFNPQSSSPEDDTATRTRPSRPEREWTAFRLKHSSVGTGKRSLEASDVIIKLRGSLLNPTTGYNIRNPRK